MTDSDAGCIFCRILADAAPGSFVHRGDLVTAFMDIRPVNPGHLLVISNDHHQHLADLGPEVASEMFRTAQSCAQAIRNSDLQCEGVNLFYADGAAANQEVFHAHLHVIPRFAGDNFSIRAGEGRKPARRELDETAAALEDLLTGIR